MLRPLKILLVKNGKIMENTTTSKKQTAQVRLDELIEVLNTTDTIIAKEIARINGKTHYSKSGVSAFRASGGNKVMTPKFLEDIEKALPFLNMEWLIHGFGNWLNEWSPKQKKDYLTKSDWYKDKPAAASAGAEDLCHSQKSIDQLLKNGTDANFKIILRSKLVTTYATGSRLRSDINKDLCQRVRELRVTRDPKESQTYFAETTMGENRAIITNVESFRQNPPIFFIKKLKEICSVDLNERLSYNWLLDGVGEIFIDQRNLPLPINPAKKPNRDNKIDRELCDRIDSIREEQGMSKTAFGSHLDVNRSMISAMTGKEKRQNPTTWFLSRLKERVNDNNKVLSYDWLLDGVGPQYIEDSNISETSNDAIEELRKEIERLKRENAQLKKS
jgi:ribosome-binding protein aMBF1 (putative translation factor)